jgi:hypothetical protein
MPTIQRAASISIGRRSLIGRVGAGESDVTQENPVSRAMDGIFLRLVDYKLMQDVRKEKIPTLDKKT